jgi:hypothetical protein
MANDFSTDINIGFWTILIFMGNSHATITRYTGKTPNSMKKLRFGKKNSGWNSGAGATGEDTNATKN